MIGVYGPAETNAPPLTDVVRPPCGTCGMSADVSVAVWSLHAPRLVCISLCEQCMQMPLSEWLQATEGATDEHSIAHCE